MGRTYADTLDDQMAAAVLLRRDDADYKWLPGGMRMSERITEADSYFIGADFGAFVEQALSSLPAETEIVPEDFPAEHGWMTVATPFICERWDGWPNPTMRTAGAEDGEIHGLHWDISDIGHIVLTVFGNIPEGVGGYVVHLGPPDTSCPCYSTIPHYWERWFKAFWLLVSQGTVSETVSEELPRPARKRAIRAGRPTSIRVIRLPKRLRESHGTHDVEWQSRWIVRGHWRKQPWGPERSRIRPVWIAPYIKGPDDAPLKDSAHRLFVVTEAE